MEVDFNIYIYVFNELIEAGGLPANNTFEIEHTYPGRKI
jgi:hypothetical protein